MGHCQSPGRLNPPGSPSVCVASDPTVGKDVTPSCDVIGKYGNGKPYCNSCAATTAFGTAEVVAGVAVSPRIEVGTAVPVETPPCDLEKAALERGLGVPHLGQCDLLAKTMLREFTQLLLGHCQSPESAINVPANNGLAGSKADKVS